MKQFLVLYLAPAAVLDAWMQKPESERQAEQDTMKADWGKWMKEHGSALKETAGAGRPQKVTQEGIAVSRNDVMMFSLVEAESDEEVAKMFTHHPHLQIPESSIEVMPINSLPNMK